MNLRLTPGTTKASWCLWQHGQAVSEPPASAAAVNPPVPGLLGDVLPEFFRLVKGLEDEMIAVRRDLHAHPELGQSEVRTTRVVAQRLAAAGLTSRTLDSGTGLICDVGRHAPPRIALRADLDALPVVDAIDTPYRSTNPGVCHACGHDIHTATVLGVSVALAELESRGRLPQPVRIIFQPAEELMPGGSYDVIAAGGLSGIERILCLHCDPRVDTGQVGLRVGPITSACDRVLVRLSGRGGHTARPHLTQDIVHALGILVTELPAALARRLDPRAGVSLVWGRINAGHTANAIPAEGWAEGTLRCLDVRAWKQAPELVRSLTQMLMAPFGVHAEVHSVRGVPPVVNESGSVRLLTAAAEAALSPGSVRDTEQSLGAEDFGWYLEHVPGALLRLGVRRPGTETVHDLHQGDFDPDERAIGLGMRVLGAAALMNSAHDGSWVGPG